MWLRSSKRDRCDGVAIAVPVSERKGRKALATLNPWVGRSVDRPHVANGVWATAPFVQRRLLTGRVDWQTLSELPSRQRMYAAVGSSPRKPPLSRGSWCQTLHMADRFGIPETMFGPVDDEFYGLIGRIVMMATLVEDRILALLWSVDDQPQPTHAGKPFSQLKSLIDARMDGLPPTLRSDIARVLKRASDAMSRRNALVHSLWPNPTLEQAQGWRSKRLPKGNPDRSEIVWTPTSAADMASDLAELMALQDEIVRCANLAWQRQQ